MDTSTVFDIFQPVKTLLYLGNYEQSAEEASNTDINEEDLNQVLRTYFYVFISSLEQGKKDDLNNVLFSLKDSNNERLIIYYNIFLLYSLYVFKGQLNEARFNKLFTDLKNVKAYDPTLFPAIYVISLILLDRRDYEGFLSLIERYESDLEILALKFYMLFALNKTEEMLKVINGMSLREPDSIIFSICSIVFRLYKENDFSGAIALLNDLKKNNKLTVKMYNFIGISLLSKGMFEEAARILQHGKDYSEKNGLARMDRNNIIVNLICANRNLGKDDQVRILEDVLRNDDPNNDYFKKNAQFNEEFEEIVKN